MQEFQRRDNWLTEVNKVLREHGIDRQFIFVEVKNYYEDYPNAYQAAVRIAHQEHLGII